MKNEALRETLVEELGIRELAKEAQDEILAKLGEIVLKSATATIFEKLSASERAEFEKISKAGNPKHIKSFLEHTIPDMPAIMEEEMKKTLESFRKGEQLIEDTK